MTSSERLRRKYLRIIDEEVFSDPERGINISVLRAVADGLQEGRRPEEFAYDRDVNMQHMDGAYFRSIRWIWDRAIRACEKDRRAQ